MRVSQSHQRILKIKTTLYNNETFIQKEKYTYMRLKIHMDLIKRQIRYYITTYNTQPTFKTALPQKWDRIKNV